MKLDHLSDGDFEELTYDLLVALGFVNLIGGAAQGEVARPPTKAATSSLRGGAQMSTAMST